MQQMIIRECAEADLPVLERHLPAPSHDERLRRQRQGLSTVLIAYVDGVPVGAEEILWRGCGEPAVQERYPDCPEINGLGVWPPGQRSRGVGTALIGMAEKLAARRGYRQIGLGVDERNRRAAALYLRIGYHKTGCRYLARYHYVDDTGIRHDGTDPRHFLIKPIGGWPLPPLVGGRGDRTLRVPGS